MEKRIAARESTKKSDNFEIIMYVLIIATVIVLFIYFDDTARDEMGVGCDYKPTYYIYYNYTYDGVNHQTNFITSTCYPKQDYCAAQGYEYFKGLWYAPNNSYCINESIPTTS